YDTNTAQWWHTAELYLSHYDPQGLFFRGFGDGVAILPPGIGELSWLELPLLLGLLYFNRMRREDFSLGFGLSFLLLLWFITFPIADTLTGGIHGQAHEIRSVSVFPLPELLAGYSAVLIWQALVRFRRLLAYLALVAGVVAYIVFSAEFLSYFFDPAQMNVVLPPFN